jgi:hypothetical protein
VGTRPKTDLAHTLWLLACLPTQAAFRRALTDVAATQYELLRDLLRRNAASSFGRRYGFASIRSVAEYQRRVPLADYDDFRPAIAQIAAGQQGLLTSEPVRLLEPTSGSSAATKLIPYTQGLRAEFQRAISPWLADLLLRDPQLRAGRAYWQITPVAQPGARSAGGLPIGFEDDAAYLGRLQQRLTGVVMATPPELRLVSDIETFRYLTLLFLLSCADLALISIWNPTFLSLLLARLPAWGEQLAIDIAMGRLRPPGRLAPALHARLAAWLHPDPARAYAVRTALAQARSPAELHMRLWPNLRLLSCWADANASRYASELAQQLPQARLQAKGLIATEGFVSLPLLGQPAAALAVRSHFFEFLPLEGGPARLAHELRSGACYEVVLSTSGGLYRYRLYDLIEVVGHLGTCPLLRFVGKTNLVADWFGEKLNERHVRAALDELLVAAELAPSFAMLACATQSTPAAYTLYLECAVPAQLLAELARTLDQQLQANMHYRYCRELGQLGPLRVFQISADASNAYLAECRRRGQRVGDIKPLALHRQDGWEAVFQGAFVSA